MTSGLLFDRATLGSIVHNRLFVRLPKPRGNCGTRSRSKIDNRAAISNVLGRGGDRTDVKTSRGFRYNRHTGSRILTIR